MKKRIVLISSIILVILIGGFAIVNFKNEKMKFGKDDVVIEGIRLGMTQEEVINILGTPKNITEAEPFFAYGECIDYTYKDMWVSFYDINEGGNLTLGDVVINSPSIELANGLKVGVTADDVLSTYYNDGKERSLGQDKKWGTLLYGDYLWTYENSYKLPEKYEQTAFYNERENIISYDYYIPKEDYVEEIRLVFFLDESNTVTRIRWYKSRL